MKHGVAMNTVRSGLLFYWVWLTSFGLVFGLSNQIPNGPFGVDQLPVDSFDEYPVDTLPPYPWQIIGRLSEKVKASLQTSGESPYVGNKVSGKGFVVSDNDEKEGQGTGLSFSFSPPPKEGLYLGFDFLLAASPIKSPGPDLTVELTDESGKGLRLGLQANGELKAGRIQGTLETVTKIQSERWYHLSIRFPSPDKAVLVLFSQTNERGSPPSKPISLGEIQDYRQLRFFSDGGHERKGGWSIDNVLMAGKVDAPRQPWLPFQKASTQELRSSTRKVFAYYFNFYTSTYDHSPKPFDEDPGLSTYTRSLFNPSMTQSDRQKAGSIYLLRPLPRLPLETGLDQEETMIRAMEEEVRLGIQMGLDGFSVDFCALPQNFKNPAAYTNLNKNGFALMEAARRVDPGFKIIPAIYAGETPLPTAPAEILMPFADAYADSPIVKMALSHPQAYRLDDGRVLFSKWGTERYRPEWWMRAMDRLKEQGIPNAYFGQFNGKNKEFLSPYSAICYAMADWGPRSPIDYQWVSRVRSLTKKAVSPIVFQDVRTRGCQYWETCGSELFRKLWKTAIDDGSDWAMIDTWCDYSEQPQAPSTSIGFVPYDLNTFYIQWFKTGVQPPIVQDTLYYFYRRHHTEVDPGRGTNWIVRKEGKGFEARDEIELLAFLKEPGKISIQIGASIFSTNAEAGITSLKAPLPSGILFTPRFSLSRNGNTLVNGTGRYSVLPKIEYPNFLYHAGVLTPDLE